MSKIEFIEEGRLSSKEMGEVIGGSKPKTYTNCSEIGPACGNVKGDYLTIIKNCDHNLYTCDTFMRFCKDDDDLAVCKGLPSDAKGVIKPTSLTLVTN